MACKLDFLRWDNYGRTVAGSDGNLLAEYKMMESLVLDASISNSYDAYTCAVAREAFWECLDIASARTLSGSYRNESIFNASSRKQLKKKD